MSINVNELPDSRDLHYGANGGGQTLRYTAVTTAGETEAQVYLAALAGTPPFYNGFIRQDLKVIRNGAPHLFRIEVEYGTTGVGGGDQPLGGVGSDGGPPTTPSGPASESTPLTSGYAFTIRPARLHILKSNQTIAKFKAGGGTATDRQNVIGDIQGDRGEPEGVDWPPEASSTFKRTTARANVTFGYLSTLYDIVGRYNDAPFYSWAAGEVLFLAADGTYSQAEGWSLTFEFGVNKNEDSITISPNLPQTPEIISKKGWQYLWVSYVEQIVGTKRVLVPDECYIEKIFPAVDFTLLEIGT